MGAGKNIRLAGDARRRQLEGLAQRRAAASEVSSTTGGPSDNPMVLGEQTAVAPNTLLRQEMYAARPGIQSPLQTQGPQFSEGITTDPTFLGRISDGSPDYEQMKQRLRGLTQLQNTGARF